jgi:hypothetical protein
MPGDSSSTPVTILQVNYYETCCRRRRRVHGRDAVSVGDTGERRRAEPFSIGESPGKTIDTLEDFDALSGEAGQDFLVFFVR